MKKSPTPNRFKSQINIEKNETKRTFNSLFSGVDWVTGRFQFAAAVFLFFWVALWFRAFYIQLIEGPSLAAQANRQHSYTEMVEARRGSIYDRNGHVLARSIEAFSIYANPRAMTTPSENAKKVAEILSISEDKLNELFARDKAFVWVKRKINDAEAKKLQEARVEGIGISKEFDRVYPQKSLAGQLLGFVGIDNMGLEGVERSFEENLSGDEIKRVVYKDGQGRRYYVDGQNPPKGDDIYLTIDAQIQYIAEEVIAKAASEVPAKWGGALIVEAQSGEIVAWAQYPFFNPNTFRLSSPEIYRNRIAADALEPGSTLKPFPVAAALQERLITPETVYNTENGTWETEYITIRDDGRAWKELSINEIIKYSSNIGMAKIGLDLGKQKYYNYLSKLGFGARTNVGIAESKGILRNPSDWSEVDLMAGSFGQSISVTGLQMAQAYLTLTNDGVFKPLKLIKDNSQTQSVEQRIFSHNTTLEVMKMLEDVVEADGTGKRARINGIRVAGKTGTAQKAAKNNVGGYGEDRFASFIGVVPAENPQYIILVMLDEPITNQYGGTIAAPVFQEVASRVLAYGGYMPDVVFAEQDTKKQDNANEKISTVQVEYSKNIQEFPKLIGTSLKQSLNILMPLGINPEVRGSGLSILYQYPAPGTPLPLVDKDGREIPCVLWLSLDEEEKKNLENQSLQTSQNTQVSQNQEDTQNN